MTQAQRQALILLLVFGRDAEINNIASHDQNDKE